MPEKDGDEGKSTKSVVNKKQKQMMGEEGYDIARDMGRVRPSKDKKDATTMPPSKEMKKIQKVNKGPSAFERVKAKYGKSVMKMEELDLTKVAEAFGGYIVEAPVDDREEKKNRAAKRLAKAAGINIRTQGPEQAAATQAFKDMRMSKDKKFTNITPDVKSGMRATAAGKGKAEPKGFSSTKGGLKGTILTPGPENAARSAIESLRRKDQQKQGRINRRKETPSTEPKKRTTRANYPKTRAELEAKRKEYEIDRQGKATDAGIEKFARRRKQSNLPLSKDDLDSAKKAMVGTGEKGTDVGKYGGTLGRRRGKNQPTFAQVKAEIDDKNPVRTSPVSGGKIPDKRKPEAFIGDKPPKKPLSFEIPGRTPRTGEPELPTFTNTDNPSFRKKKSIVGKAVTKTRQLAKDEPVLGIAAYDLGKGILGKIMNARMPSLQGVSGFRSAKGGGGL